MKARIAIFSIVLAAAGAIAPRPAIALKGPLTYDGLGIVVYAGPALVAIQRQGLAHLDNSGRIVLHRSTPDPAGWIPTTIYDSTYDDRNVAGGVTPKGTLVVFFGRYDASVSQWIDMGYILSRDSGLNWSSYRTVPAGGDTHYSPYGGLVVLPSGKLMQLVYGNDGRGRFRVRALFSSDDGDTWGEDTTIVSTRNYKATEASALLVDGKTDAGARLMMVVRTAPPTGWKGAWRGGMMEFVSANGGRTWQRRGQLPLSKAMSDVSPWLAATPGGGVALVWADRAKLELRVARVNAVTAWRSVGAWSSSTSVYRSRLAGRAVHVNAAHFGYPSVASGSGAPTIVFYDINPQDSGAEKETDPAIADLETLKL